MNGLFIIIMILGLIVLIYAILTFADREKIYRYWNDCIAEQCNYQNEVDRAFSNIPSLQSAWVCQNEYVREMHRSIFLLHNDLLIKVEEYFKAMLACAEESRDSNPPLNHKGGFRYFPFQINREVTSLVETFGLTNLQIPSFNFGLLIIEPGTITPWKRSLSKGLYRYHYALKLPEKGNFGLYLHGKSSHLEIGDASVHQIKWKERQGFIWDSTIEHQLRNYSSEPCFLLIADISRYFSWKNHLMNNLLHIYFPPSLEKSEDLQIRKVESKTL